MLTPRTFEEKKGSKEIKETMPVESEEPSSMAARRSYDITQEDVAAFNRFEEYYNKPVEIAPYNAEKLRKRYELDSVRMTSFCGNVKCWLITLGIWSLFMIAQIIVSYITIFQPRFADLSIVIFLIPIYRRRKIKPFSVFFQVIISLASFITVFASDRNFRKNFAWLLNLILFVNWPFLIMFFIQDFWELVYYVVKLSKQGEYTTAGDQVKEIIHVIFDPIVTILNLIIQTICLYAGYKTYRLL